MSTFGGFGGGFGSSNTGATGGFGSGFGSNNNNTSSGFGASSSPAFGSASNTGGNLFGGGATSTGAFGSGTTGFGASSNTGGGFGAAKPAFGATSSGGGLFGSSSTTPATGGTGFGTGGFGNNTANSTSAAFGGGSTGSLFGNSTAKPAFGSGTTGTTGGLFGSTGNTATSGTGFGSAFNNPTSTALQSTPVGDPPGTAGTAFTPFVEKESAASNAQNSFQNILFQDPYKKWSSEELRLADYAQGRRYGSGAGTGFGGGGFGFGSTSTPASNTGGFGTNTNTTNLFGGTNNTTSTTGGFGQQQQQQQPSTGAFGTGGGVLFGQNKPATGGLFASGNTTTQPASSGGLFGSGGTTNNAFGSNTGSTNAFGPTNNNTSGSNLFGSANNQQKPSGFSFGTTNTTGTGGFGSTNNNTASGFGSTGTTGSSMFGNANNNTSGQNSGGGIFGNNTQQQSTGGLGTGGFGTQNQNQTQTGGGLFGGASNQQKPASTGLFGSANTNTTGGGLFGQQNNTQSTPFGQNNNTQSSGGLFGNKPAATTGGGLFGNANQTQNNTGSSLFGGLGGQNNQQQQQQQQQNQSGGGLFGGLGASQQKPTSLFGASTTSSGGGGLFGNTNNQQGSLFGNSTQQQQQPQLGGSLFGSVNNQAQPQQSFTASINDPSAYGQSLFGNLPAQTNDPGPLATPLSTKKQSRRPSVLPMYKLNPASASRLMTPQKRGFGFSYSTYGTPNSPSSTASTPGSLGSNNLLTGSLSRSLSKSISSSNLRRSFNVEDSLLARDAFSSSTGATMFGRGNNVKKLVINKDLRSDLFSTPNKDKPLQDTPNGSRKLSKRVSFDTGNDNNVDAQNEFSIGTPSAEDLGYIRPSSSTNGVNGSKSRSSFTGQESDSGKGKELAIVHEEEAPVPASSGRSTTTTADKALGEYYMRPSKEEIENMNRVQRSKILGFTVGRVNSGEVTFEAPVDLTQVDWDNLYDSIVVLETRSCTVYPNPAKKPPVGKGLNVPSLIKLENSWPRSSKKANLTKHIERLKRIEGTEFVVYNPDTGVWQFRVPHFTRYGLDYEEDDDTEFEPLAEVSADRANIPAQPASPSPVENVSDADDDFGCRRDRWEVPGAFDNDSAFDESEAEMAEVNQSRSSFLGDRSAGSKSRALVPVAQNELDDEYAMSEDHEDASASLGHHHAAEQDDNSFDACHVGLLQETPGGVMRARMRAMKESATPSKVQVATGDDWMDMLQKTMSPQKRDRVKLKSIREADNYGKLRESVQERSPAKRQIVSDSRGFATSIDLMKSIFEKAPVEPVRPQSVKFPWERTTKNFGEGEMAVRDREWHDTLRPTWGPNGTLVFSATPSETPFGRSGTITEKNGLMTVLRGGIVSESQDIRIAKFTNETSAKALRQYIKLTNLYLDNDVPTVMGPRVSLRDFYTDSGNKNPAAEHEKLVWELASVLFDSIKIPAELQNDPGAVEKIRRDSLSRFWERLVEDKTNEGITMARSSEEKALSALAGHKVPEALKHLLEGKNFRLATLISVIGTSDEVKADMREQLKEWQDGNVLSEFSQPIRALYEILSGNVCVCEGTKGGSAENRIDSFVISREFGLNWKQAFGLRLWYAISAEDTIAEAVKRFKDDFAQDKELRPTTWYAEHRIKGVWNDPDEDLREDLLWGLLELYSSEGTDLEAVLRPENSQLSPLDYRLSWQLGKALTATGKASFGRNAEEKADAATISFASQLTNEGSWQEATFVLLHLSDPEARAKALQEHLCRHAGLISDGEGTFKNLSEKLKIPAKWIWHAKALHARSVKEDSAVEVQCLLRAESFAEAHRTFIKQVAPRAIIERDYDGLANLLQQFDGHQSLVPDWNLGGEVYKAFLQLMGHQRRHEQPPAALVGGLLEGLPAMHGNTPDADINEYAALTDMAAEVAKVVGDMAKSGQMEHQRILKLPLTEDALLKHTRDLAWSHFTNVMAGY